MGFFDALKDLFWETSENHMRRMHYHASDWAENTFGNLKNPEPYALAEAIDTFLKQMEDEVAHVAKAMGQPDMKFTFEKFAPESETEPFLWAIKSEYKKVAYNIIGLKREKLGKKFQIFTYKNVNFKNIKRLQENNAPYNYEYRVNGTRSYKQREEESWKTQDSVLVELQKIVSASMRTEYKQLKLRYYQRPVDESLNDGFVQPNDPIV